ncbi:hypothetical protein UUU_36530 (plasmid) [Klebsiella pneumoniae subsp. pneumoniae DSM 30104 = JCM 1662 = NBRC 14940]|nr:hypothetical protein UUU_36530 [Klebsiella pneumoniae subsp. pneumoniae DSM 30104 = JCM 1662 = NBRC 14940]
MPTAKSVECWNDELIYNIEHKGRLYTELRAFHAPESDRNIRCNESGEVPAASWDHNITVQENIRSPKSDIRILELQLSSQC